MHYKSPAFNNLHICLRFVYNQIYRCIDKRPLYFYTVHFYDIFPSVCCIHRYLLIENMYMLAYITKRTTELYKIMFIFRIRLFNH